jgi:hypothetical protein
MAMYLEASQSRPPATKNNVAEKLISVLRLIV